MGFLSVTSDEVIVRLALKIACNLERKLNGHIPIFRKIAL